MNAKVAVTSRTKPSSPVKDVEVLAKTMTNMTVQKDRQQNWVNNTQTVDPLVRTGDNIKMGNSPDINFGAGAMIKSTDSKKEPSVASGSNSTM